MKKIRVLLAADFALTRIALRRLLEGVPDIEIIGESDEIDNFAREGGDLRPDVILMEAGVPGSYGVRATAHTGKAIPHVRLVVLTDNSNPGYVRSSSGSVSLCIESGKKNGMGTGIATRRP